MLSNYKIKLVVTNFNHLKAHDIVDAIIRHQIFFANEIQLDAFTKSITADTSSGIDTTPQDFGGTEESILKTHTDAIHKANEGKCRVEITYARFDKSNNFLSMETICLDDVRRTPEVTASGAINDYICGTCKNDRCSKSEKKCWRCGAIL